MVDQMTAENSDAAPAAEAASRVTEEAAAQTSAVTSAAKEHAGAVVSEVKQQARGVAHDVQHELQRQADQQARRAGHGLRSASTQLRTMADGGEPGVVTDLTRELAGALDRVSTRVNDGGLRAIGDDLRGFARRQPGLFLLGAGVAGFLFARVVRAGAAHSELSPPGDVSATSSSDVQSSTGPASPGAPTSTSGVATAARARTAPTPVP
jgi:hypothetical protein